MNGLGVPLVTPFDEDGDVDEDALADLVAWVTDGERRREVTAGGSHPSGVDFVVPCASHGEAELLTVAERDRVTEVVVEATPPDVDVLAGTGHPGYRETREQTRRAADAGVDGALVVAPCPVRHDESTVAAYYRDLADESEVPLYLSDTPQFTGTALSVETAAALATHENVHGMVDTAGDFDAFQRLRERTREEAFELFVGDGSLLAPALDAGADGGVCALANVVPGRLKEVCELHLGGEDDAARQLDRRLLELDHAVTDEYGVPGLKAATDYRGAPAGAPRRPHRPVDDDARTEIETLVDDALP
ncbi:dihydrodipicolinate synthase family protein [Halospeciosus flavus]|uniref:Dihydrodipicolinate synthase family protein n=1 Tax=Halospeciosus flavus TaxID=3032283 RepID=A0ABD5Z7W8_9EURY|nr:dihydrodipicolinate synthase family protein [Halospeciosus flavus]